LAVLLAVGLAAGAGATTPAGVDVPTYHNDNLRTGWNAAETVLTPASVASANFGLLQQVAVDDQVTGQPLFLSALSINGGTHDVVYVVTENNTLFAIDAVAGTVLASRNFGPPVPGPAIPPASCGTNFGHIGIHSTPVIDRSANALYLITYTYETTGGVAAPVYRLHSVNLATLQDNLPSTVIAASNTLSTGAAASFNPVYLGQRTALLQSNGNIYAGFNGWCEDANTAARGWVLGWQAASLTPLAANKLMNQEAKAAKNFFLNSVWMSGAGIASDDSSGIYFLTGNGAPNGRSYDSQYNLVESAVALSFDLTTVAGFFTPEGGPVGWAALDKLDNDFSAGGILLLPDQPGAVPHMAVAAGKEGPLYLLNRDNLGGLGAGRKVTLGAYDNGGCWCTAAYYQGSDGIGRVVASTGDNVQVWQVSTAKKTKLVSESISPALNSGQFPGFFTSVSSNGTHANSAVIWAVARPTNVDPGYVYLWAFDPANGSAALLPAPAPSGAWPNGYWLNANVVPTVANGQVFVASYGTVAIYGLAPAGARHPSFRAPPPPPPIKLAGATHALHGVVLAQRGALVTLRSRTGRVVTADIAASPSPLVAIGRPVAILGNYAKDGTLIGTYVLRAKPQSALWAADY
jgi:hypothetical protein